MDVMCEVLESRPRYYNHDTVWHDQELDYISSKVKVIEYYLDAHMEIWKQSGSG